MAAAVAGKAGVSGGWTDGIWHDRLMNVGAPARIFRVTRRFSHTKASTEMWAGGCRRVEVEVKVPSIETLPHLNSWLNETGVKGAGCFQGRRQKNKQQQAFVALTEKRKTFGQASFSAPSFPHLNSATANGQIESDYDRGQKHNSRRFQKFRAWFVNLCSSNFQNPKSSTTLSFLQRQTARLESSLRSTVQVTILIL